MKNFATFAAVTLFFAGILAAPINQMQARSIFDDIGNAFEDAGNAVAGGVTSVANDVASGVTTAANDVASGATTAFNTVQGGVETAANTVAGGVTTAVDAVAKAASDAYADCTDITNGMCARDLKILAQAPGQLKEQGSLAISAIKDKFGKSIAPALEEAGVDIAENAPEVAEGAGTVAEGALETVG